MAAKLSRLPADVFARNGFTVRGIRANLRAVFHAATDDQISQGLVWYPDAHAFATDLARATETDLVVVAAVIAALSPQTRWDANKAAAIDLLKNGVRSPGMLISNYERALRVLRAGPMGALAALQIRGDETAPKIAAFARNILGDSSRVTIDVWAVRAALGNLSNAEALLTRAGMYGAISQQYQFLAREFDVTGPEFQAIVWITTRGKAA